MPNDPMLWVALVAFVGAILFVVFHRPTGKAPAASVFATAPARGPGRALIDAVEEAGKDHAGTIIEQRLGERKAGSIAAELAAALNTPGPPSPKGP